jgi:hypothetical protein
MSHSDVAKVVAFIVTVYDKTGQGAVQARVEEYMPFASVTGVLMVARTAGLVEDVGGRWTPTPYGRHMHNAWSVG